MAPRHYPVRRTSSWDVAPEPPRSHDSRAYESERKEFGDKVVIVVVGNEETKYSVHESLLCGQSAFFRAAVKKEWKRYDHGIPLPDDLPEVMNLYVQWVYQNRICSRKSAEEPGTICSEISLLVDAYIFGDKIQDWSFADAIIDAIIKSANTPTIDKSEVVPDAHAIQKAFAGTLPDSPLRRLMVDVWSRHAHSIWVTDGMPPDFLTDLARSLLDIRAKLIDIHPADGNATTCSYHHHTEEQLCYSRSSDAHLLMLL